MVFYLVNNLYDRYRRKFLIWYLSMVYLYIVFVKVENNYLK